MILKAVSERLCASPLGNSGVDEKWKGWNILLDGEIIPNVCRKQPKEILTVCRAESDNQRWVKWAWCVTSHVQKEASLLFSHRGSGAPQSLPANQRRAFCVPDVRPISSGPTSFEKATESHESDLRWCERSFPFPRLSACSPDRVNLVYPLRLVLPQSFANIQKIIPPSFAPSVAWNCCEATFIFIDLTKTFFFF